MVVENCTAVADTSGMTFTVFAETCCGPRVLFGSFPDSATAAAAVCQADDAGRWPEGADAVAQVDGGWLMLNEGGDEWVPVDVPDVLPPAHVPTVPL